MQCCSPSAGVLRLVGRHHYSHPQSQLGHTMAGGELGQLQELGVGEEEEARVWLGHKITPALVEAAAMVLSDMTLILLSVVANLLVLNSLREKEELLGITQNLVSPSTSSTQVLLNMCTSNLVSAVFVKSISIVHHGFAVATGGTHSTIAFCTIYTFGHR